MNSHDTGRLRAYLDGELTPDERQTVAVHLDHCAECGAELEMLQRRVAGIAITFGDLEAGAVVPAPQAALRRFREAEAVRGRASDTSRGWENVTRSLEMIKRSAVYPRWRPAVVALTAVLVVALLFSIAPVRLAAADFLGLFRIRKFAVIPLDPQQMERLGELARQAEGAFGDPEIVREEGPDEPVSDAAHASALAGFAVRAPSRLPDAATLERFVVRSGPAVHYELDRAALEMMLQAAGATTAGLPQTEKLAFDVDVAQVVVQQYRLPGGRAGFGEPLELVQVLSPKVNIPDGIDPVALAETGFMFLGMPAADARRMANSIDWTSTLVVPLPTSAAQAREVTVDGVTGLLLEGVSSRNQVDSALLWEKDGILYFLSGRVETRVLLEAADSLQ